MKFSWRVALLWALPILVIGFFFWQGAFSGNAADMGRNTASTRMTYGRFLDYLDSGRVTAVDLYDGWPHRDRRSGGSSARQPSTAVAGGPTRQHP
jgi:hypothetical protein